MEARRGLNVVYRAPSVVCGGPRAASLDPRAAPPIAARCASAPLRVPWSPRRVARSQRQDLDRRRRAEIRHCNPRSPSGVLRSVRGDLHPRAACIAPAPHPSTPAPRLSIADGGRRSGTAFLEPRTAGRDPTPHFSVRAPRVEIGHRAARSSHLVSRSGRASLHHPPWSLDRPHSALLGAAARRWPAVAGLVDMVVRCAPDRQPGDGRVCYFVQVCS